MQLLEKGRTVVAAARDVSKAQEVFKELGLSEGINKGFGTVRSGPCIPTLPLVSSLLHFSTFSSGLASHTILNAADRAADWVA